MNHSNQLTRQRLRNGFAFLLAATGFGLCGYAGLLWRELPSYSEQEVRTSVELNLTIDLSRRKQQGSLVDPQQIDIMRKQITDEVEADIAKERQWPLHWLRSGLVLAALALLIAWPSLAILKDLQFRRKASL